jgi:hypothetical protein
MYDLPMLMHPTELPHDSMDDGLTCRVLPPPLQRLLLHPRLPALLQSIPKYRVHNAVKGAIVRRTVSRLLLLLMGFLAGTCCCVLLSWLLSHLLLLLLLLWGLLLLLDVPWGGGTSH